MTSAIAHLPEVFTIGHSNHELPAFVALLKRHGISAVADVRSQPYSQFNPQFHREPLERILQAHGVDYLFLGKELGARRAEPQAYVNATARYDLVARLPLFQSGLDRVRSAAREQRIALMCAEKDPITCHRMVLVTRKLRGRDLLITHILEDGRAETNDQAETRLLAVVGLPEGDLFQSRSDLIEQAYEKQGEKIAYREAEPNPAAGR